MRASSDGWSWKPPKRRIHDFAPAIVGPKIGSQTSGRRETAKRPGEALRRRR